MKTVKIKDLTDSFKNFWQEYARFKMGLIGLFLLIGFVLTALFAPIIASGEAYENWSDIAYWEEHPKGVPPAWTDYFSSKKAAVQYVSTDPYLTIKLYGQLNISVVNATFNYDYYYDVPPENIIIKIWANISGTKSGVLSLHVVRPDNKTISNLVTEKHKGGVIRIPFLRRADEKVKKGLSAFARQYESEENLKKIETQEHLINLMAIVFSKAEPGIMLGKAGPLKGEYKFVMQLSLFNEGDVFDSARMIIAGSVYGLLGTDTYGRDLFVGIVWGSRLALVIGLLTAVISVTIGVFYGVTSAYLGGTTDEVMQRIMETIASIPLLPILIIISFVMQPTIWNLVLLMIVFYWVGPVKTIRSMALQIKEEAYIEASRALGCSGWRIVFKHITPQVLPYMFALMAMAVPGAILTEAGVSFLMGMQGVSEPTWGRILHDAQAASATINGMWWWVLSPGVLICIAGLTFVFIGNALDRVLNPTLKR